MPRTKECWNGEVSTRNCRYAHANGNGGVKCMIHNTYIRYADTHHGVNSDHDGGHLVMLAAVESRGILYGCCAMCNYFAPMDD